MVTPVTVFSDFACPASYVTEAALWELGGEVAVAYRAFELYPEGGSGGTARFDDAEWNEIQRLAGHAGVTIRPRADLPRTRKAHEAAHFAREKGREIELRRAIFTSIWTGGRDVGRIDVLADLADEVGLDAEDLRIALDIDRYQADVDAELALARRLRVPGTPVVFVGTGSDARIIAGARTGEDFSAELALADSQRNRTDHV